MSYAVIKTGGKQYRVEEGQTLLVEKLPGDVGDKVELETLLSVGDDVVHGGAAQAEIVAHEKGPKLRVVKFKPKRGYKRRTGHRQSLTRIRVTGVGSEKKAAKPKAAAAKPAETTATAEGTE